MAKETIIKFKTENSSYEVRHSTKEIRRVGGKYSNLWHVEHLTNPEAVVPESLNASKRRVLPWLLRSLPNLPKPVALALKRKIAP